MDRRIFFMVLLFLNGGVLLFGEGGDGSYRDSRLRRGSLITGSLAAAGVLTVYSLGPYSEFDFKEYPAASTLMLGSSSSIILGTSLIYSNLLAGSLYRNDQSLPAAVFKGAWTGALAGGVGNGLSFSCILGIGASSGAIVFNDPSLNGNLFAAFVGGFLFGLLPGAFMGALEGLLFSAFDQ